MLGPLTRQRQRLQQRGAPPNGGFTLIELAITLAVLAVLGALALPNMGARLAHQRLLAAAHALASDVADARFEAAQRGMTLHVQARAGSTDWCWSVATAPDCGCSAVASPKTICQLRNVPAVEHPGVRLRDAQSAQLDPTGSAAARQLAVLESKQGETLRVDISALGRPRVCALSGSWPQLPAC